MQGDKGNQKERIAPLDALRTFSALGVVWIHSWTYAGNPSFKTLGVDLYRFIAILGNGVNFFFVISGFFMFIVVSKKEFSKGNYLKFLSNRWKRIAPAYYFSAVVYAIFFLLVNSNYPFFKMLLINFTFLNNLSRDGNIIAPFWSLGTEWHFYLLLPLLFISKNNRHFLRMILVFALASLLSLLLINRNILDEVFWRPQVLPRFIEFAWGCLAAYIYINKIPFPVWMRYAKGMILAAVVTYAGRLLMVTEVVSRFGNYGWLARSFAEPVMTFGFAWFMYLTVTEKNWLTGFLSKSFFSYLGKLSFGIYLWHTFILMLLGYLKFGNLSAPCLNSVLIFFIASLFSIFIAHFSYKYLEAPYFRSKSA